MTEKNSTLSSVNDHVIYVMPYYDPEVPSGGNRRFDELCKRFLAEFGDNFSLVIAKGKTPPWWNGKNLIEVDYAFDHPSKFTAAKQIARFLDSQPPSIVIIESIPIPFRALRRHKHFQVAYDFRYFTGDSKGFWYRLFFSRFLKRQWSHSEFMVTCSDFSIDELKKYVGYDPKRVVKSFFGIDERVLDIAKTSAPQKEYDIIYVGHFEKRKNHEPLIRALPLIDKNIRAIFIGRDNGLLEGLKHLSNELGLKNVEFITSGVSDAMLWDLYRKSRVFAYPSIYEGFGIPTIEALALGVPAVIADIPVFHEVGGDLVTYFDPHDPTDIARKISDRLQDGKIPSQEAVRVHLEQFFWQNIYEAFVSDLGIKAKQ